MLKIGDFSKMAMVSVRMLRYYDEHGLLSPVRIDPESGYRYYDVSQLAEVQEIKLLQRFGVRLADIRSLKVEGDEIVFVAHVTQADREKTLVCLYMLYKESLKCTIEKQEEIDGNH